MSFHCWILLKLFRSRLRPGLHFPIWLVAGQRELAQLNHVKLQFTLKSDSWNIYTTILKIFLSFLTEVLHCSWMYIYTSRKMNCDWTVDRGQRELPQLDYVKLLFFTLKSYSYILIFRQQFCGFCSNRSLLHFLLSVCQSVTVSTILNCLII